RQAPQRAEAADAVTALLEHARVVGRVEEQLAYVIGEQVVAPVQQVDAEVADRAVHQELLVDERLGEAAAAAPDEPGPRARVPATVTDEAAEGAREAQRREG